MYKAIIIMFCSICCLYSMEENSPPPPGSPIFSYLTELCQKAHSPNTHKSAFIFKNDTQHELVVTTYAHALKKLKTFTLSKNSSYYLEINEEHKNHYLSMSKVGQPQEFRPIMIDMYSYFLDKKKQVKEIICVNTDGIFLYYEFLQNPVTINTVISLQRIWAHAEQA